MRRLRIMVAAAVALAAGAANATIIGGTCHGTASARRRCRDRDFGYLPGLEITAPVCVQA